MTKPFKIDDMLKEIAVILAKRYGKGSLEPAHKLKTSQKRILVVESEVQDLGKIVGAFLSAGFLVDPANAAIKAFELAVVDQTDLILINIALPDLPGDLLARRLRQLPKTMDIPLVLYSTTKDGAQLSLAREVCRDLGIKAFIETSDPAKLVKEVQRILTS